MKTLYSFSLRGLFIACMILFAATAQSAVSGNWTDTGNYATTWQGSGTKNAPYKIGTAAELARLTYLTNTGGYPSYSGKYFVLTADIDLSAHYWKPIYQFAGNLDAKGHSINNMIFPSQTSTPQYSALIQFLQPNGVISNLHVGSNISVEISNGNSANRILIGSIIGINTGTISNCVNTGNITVSKSYNSYIDIRIGGIAGTNSNTIRDCYSTGNIQVSGSIDCSIGGIAGTSQSFSSVISISNCFSTGTINTSSARGAVYSGGVLGLANAAGSITNSYFLQDATTNAGLSAVGKVISGVTITGTPEPKTPDQFKAASFVNTLNGSQSPAPWKADLTNINNGYPILAWQKVQSNNWTDAGNYATTWQGTGTQADPYQISTAAELAKLAYETNNGAKPDFSGNYFVLTADIDLSGHYWTPINDFNGNLDGNGHVINNMHIIEFDKRGLGFIRYLNNDGIVQRLGIGSGSSITISDFNTIDPTSGIGCIVSSSVGIIQNCFNSGNIKITATNSAANRVPIGGIVGLSRNTIQDCYTTGTIELIGTVTCSVGAIVGTVSRTFSNCFSTTIINTAGITSNTEFISGALAGSAYSNITNSYFLQEGTINAGLKGIGEAGAQLTDDTHPQTSAQLKAASFVTALNTAQSSASWKADLSPNINNGYPILTWQKATITALPQTTVNTIKFYPNPARNYIELQGTTTILPVKIFDMTGRMMINTQAKPGEKLNIAALANGWYTINIDGQSLKMLKD